MIGLENLGDGSTPDRNFRKLNQLVIDPGGVSLGMRIGTASASFVSSAITSSVVVDHGLGREPQLIVMQPRGGGGVQASVDARTDTTFTFRGYTTTGASTVGTLALTYDWLVIG